MQGSSLVHRPIVILRLSRRISNVITFANAVAAALKGNAALPSPTPTLAAFDADIRALQIAESIALTRAKGTADERDVRLATVKGDLQQLAAYVQAIADTNLTTAPAVIESAGFGVRKAYRRSKQDLSVRAGLVAGSVILTAKAAGDRASYDWQYSEDQTSWTTLPATLQAKTRASGLAPGQLYFFRTRATTKVGQADWGVAVPYATPWILP